jgi:type IV pilus assembly protein PilY1
MMVNQTPPASIGYRVASCLIAGFFALAWVSAVNATVAQTPLFLTQGVEPQVMLSLSNDHQLFFEAYPDYLDLDGNGQPDLTYGHDNDYYGYFDSYKCYDYSTGSGTFVPAGEVNGEKYCDGVAGVWSGNFLNYLTMSRMDIVRKILFGGFRRIDSSARTVLERAYLPTDAHSWVKFYDGSDINRLTPFSNDGVVRAGSDSERTPTNGNVTFNISSNTSAFMNSVQVGDQVRISNEPTLLGNLLNPGQSFMLGAVTNINSGNNRITVDVESANGSSQLSNWEVENLSRSGVSFCNTTNNASLSGGEVVPAGKPPRLSVARGNYGLWSANERYQCRWSDEVNNDQGVNANNIGVTQFAANSRSPVRAVVGLGQNNYNVRVEACVSGLEGAERCKEYPDGNLKPIGLLQQYGDDNQILFGLLSGSYLKNKSGGVLRKNVSAFGDEINVQGDGAFLNAPTTGGIVNSLNLLRMYGYGSDGVYTQNPENCPFGLKSFIDGQCMGWGNPQSEIFLESIRYFAGAAPTSDFAFTGPDRLVGLSGQPWQDSLSEELQCAPLNVINFNSSAASYDRNQLQSVSDIAGLGGVTDIRDIVNSIGASEGINNQEWFVGQTDSVNNSLCTSKLVGSLAEVAGLCPEAPRLGAGFDAVGIANHAYENDIRTDITGDQNVKTFAVALAPAVPRIDIPRPGATERAVTILPACQNTQDEGNCAIVDFKVISQDLNAGTGLFLVNWEAAEQGGDYDQDMYGTIEYVITDSTLEITTRVAQQSSGRPLAFGYVLNGTNKNGFHAHSGINGYSYNDPTGVIDCNNCRVTDGATTPVPYVLSSGETRDGLLESPMFYAAKWAGYDKQADFPTDTQSWDADGDGLPDNYYFAIDPAKLATDLELVFADILRSSSAAASVAASSSSLSTDTVVYQASFNSEDWSGDLRAFSIEDDGSVSDTFNWSAAARLDNLSDANIDNRNIITNDSLSADDQLDGELLSVTGKPFLWNELDDDQKLALRENFDATQSSEAVGALRVEYLRGDRSEERNLDTNPSGLFRERDSRLGDIINSNPQFVAQQNFGYQNLNGFPAFSAVTSYNTFRASNVDRPPFVVVGGNDGMLHGFNASEGTEGGKELFAYVPSEIMGNLSELTELNYSHRYYVDGSPRVSDAWLGTDMGWRTLAVGATGAGGSSIFALDVTDPLNVGQDEFLWEFSHPDMDRTLQQPAIVPMPNGQFAVVVSSGFSDTAAAGGGKVWLLNAATGRPIRTFELPDSGQLGSPLAVDLDNDRIIDRIYVGDSEGQLWRLDTGGTNVSQWGSVPNALKNGNDLLPLFTAPDGQPITAQLSSAFNERGEHMVFFGTGSFIRQGDNIVGLDPDLQAFYGIIDGGFPVGIDNLLEQEILIRLTPQDLLDQGVVSDLLVGTPGVTALSNKQITSEKRGWYINLVWKTSFGGPGANGERVTSRALVRGDRVIFTSLIPSADACAAGGTSWLYEVDIMNGGRLSYSVFDLNNDNQFNDDDFITITDENGDPIRVPVSGLNPNIGIINTPVVLTDRETGDERKIFTGSSGQIISVPEAGSINRGRQNWEQIR